MMPTQPVKTPLAVDAASGTPCPHTHVRVVSRDEDAEYVECLACREVFESSELRDMDIEKNLEQEEE
jgi:hypothetical protein